MKAAQRDAKIARAKLLHPKTTHKILRRDGKIIERRIRHYGDGPLRTVFGAPPSQER